MELIHKGNALLDGRRVNGQMAERAAEAVEEADVRSADMETGERTCRRPSRARLLILS